MFAAVGITDHGARSVVDLGLFARRGDDDAAGFRVFEPRTLRNVSRLGRQCLPGYLPGSASDQDRKPRLQELAELFWTHSGGPKD